MRWGCQCRTRCDGTVALCARHAVGVQGKHTHTLGTGLAAAAAAAAATAAAAAAVGDGVLGSAPARAAAASALYSMPSSRCVAVTCTCTIAKCEVAGLCCGGGCRARTCAHRQGLIVRADNAPACAPALPLWCRRLQSPQPPLLLQRLHLLVRGQRSCRRAHARSLPLRDVAAQRAARGPRAGRALGAVLPRALPSSPMCPRAQQQRPRARPGRPRRGRCCCVALLQELGLALTNVAAGPHVCGAAPCMEASAHGVRCVRESAAVAQLHAHAQSRAAPINPERPPEHHSP